MKDASVERTPEALLVTILPLLVDDLERDVFVRGAGVDPEDARLAYQVFGFRV